MRNKDIIHLFEVVAEGTLVYIEPPPLVVGQAGCRKVHLAGIFGTGMSALAQYLRFQGIQVSGSDRLLGSQDTAAIHVALEGLGCIIVNQDGSGIDEETDALCVSTAIEDSNPDIAAAHTRAVPIVHRSDLLASLIATKKTIAVAGTSGKSTVTAMIFEFLTACEKSPSLISGAPLRGLEKQGMIGNAYGGGSNLLVVEADESDGTLVKYAPDFTVLLNISKDHKDVNEIKGLFETLISRSGWIASNAEDSALASLPASVRFGQNHLASWRTDDEECGPASVKLSRGGIEYALPLPGKHNLENLRAALCVCEHLGCERKALAEAVKGFKGVARRFTLTETREGICVVDDYAHNPAKIAAAVSAARAISPRIVAAYQPHGFGPTRFLKDEYVSTFRTVFQGHDALCLLPIYYAGGTVQKDISSQDIVDGLGEVSFEARAVTGREELLAWIKAEAKPSDCVLIMGARDPSLPALVGRIVALFGGKTTDTS
jgi:UDP-N-acetylmuramate--alanine ligase